MPSFDDAVAVEEIQVGDHVAFKLSADDPAHGFRGKVIGMINTQDAQTLVDVEWDTLGPPRRLNISRLTKI
jgi:hypothetical protein